MDNIHDKVKSLIKEKITDSEIEVYSSGSHFDIKVISNEFENKTLLQKQRLVYSAIAPLMSGPEAPIHAVDRLETITPNK